MRDWQRIAQAGWSDIGLAAITYLIATFAAVICWLLATGGLPGNVVAVVALCAPVFLGAVFIVGAGAELLETRKAELLEMRKAELLETQRGTAA